MTTLTPYLFFGGRTEAALSFYAEALAGRATVIIRMGVLTDRFGIRWMLNWSPPAKE